MKTNLTLNWMIKMIFAMMMINLKWTLHRRVWVKILNPKTEIKMMILINKVLQVPTNLEMTILQLEMLMINGQQCKI
uniref:Putative secreted protein n=1 Tax=Xenopsylla cheopis TaxID=163159 RepID=A0A6M2DZ67_XENCH